MKKRFIFLFILSGILSAQVVLAAFSGACPPLEITYPQIPRVTTPATQINQCLPVYINYIFYFSVAVVGFLVLGALIYHGFRYLTSFGSAPKMTDARSGILSALLGVVILLASYLVFNTINPQLVSLKGPEITTVTRPIQPPGLYLCNYQVSNIYDILSKYANSVANEEERARVRKEGAVLLSTIMSQENGTKTCWRVKESGNLRNFKIKNNDDKYTIFVVPKEVYFPSLQAYYWMYDTGAVLHEKNNFSGKGRCQLWPKSTIAIADLNGRGPGGTGDIYYLSNIQSGGNPPKNEGFSNRLSFDVRSITVFQAVMEKPDPADQGAILYECVSYNEDSTKCKTNSASSTPVFVNFRPGSAADVRAVKETGFKNVEPEIWAGDRVNFKSVEMDPASKFFALLFDKSNLDQDNNEEKNKCQIIKGAVSDISKLPVGKCGWGQNHSCVNSMYVVKGQILQAK